MDRYVVLEQELLELRRELVKEAKDSMGTDAPAYTVRLVENVQRVDFILDTVRLRRERGGPPK